MDALFVVVRVCAGVADTIEVYGADEDQKAMDAAASIIWACDYQPGEDNVQVFCVQPGKGRPYGLVSPLLASEDVEEILKKRGAGVFCRFCHRDAGWGHHLDRDGLPVCEECWDERLR